MNRSSAPLASPSLSSYAHSLVPAPRTPAGRGGVPRVGLRALTVALTLGVLGCGASNDCESLRICSPDKSAEDNAKTEDKGTKTDENAQKDDKKSPDNGKNEDGKQTEPKEPSGAPGGSGGHAGEGDETPLAGAASFQDEAPYLVRVSPKRGAQGVRVDAEVQLTFSEAMNKRSVERSLSVADYLPGELNFSWNEEGTIVRIVPQEGFAYATGETPQQTPALEYRITQGRDALDLDGEKLKRAEEFSFTTLRRISTSLPAEVAAAESDYGIKSADHTPSTCQEESDGLFRVGSLFGPTVAGKFFAWAVFNTSDLASGSLQAELQFESALFRVNQGAAKEGFYPGGVVKLDKLIYQPVDQAVVYAEMGAELGVLCDNPANTRPVVDVSAQVATDFAAGRHLQLYQLQGKGGVSNTQANFECNSFRLDITYLIP